MRFSLAVLASLAGFSVAAPKAQRVFGDTYTYYKGNGTLAAGWPDTKAWGTYAQLFKANLPLMQQSCGWNSYGANDSPTEITVLNSSIQTVSASAGVDARFTLAIVMQESGGCVRVPTTGNGVRNPGLMQSHNGTGTCHEKTTIQSPCPAATIRQMILDGTNGTRYGDGLRQTRAKTLPIVGNNQRSFYTAARLYNSGSVNYNKMEDGLGSTNCYVTDVANRLMGWTFAKNTCTA